MAVMVKGVRVSARLLVIAVAVGVALAVAILIGGPSPTEETPNRHERGITTTAAVESSVASGGTRAPDEISAGDVSSTEARAAGNVPAAVVTSADVPVPAAEVDPDAASAPATPAVSQELVVIPDTVSKDTADAPGSANAARVVVDAAGDDPSGPDPAKPGDPTAPAAQERPVSADGQVYTYQDGDRTRRVRLQLDLVAVEGEAGVLDRIVTAGARSASGGGQPVFRAESSDTLMTLPGGVILVVDENWGRDRVDEFFDLNGISHSRVAELGWLPNGFFIETEPGFASLDLANALAGQDGVDISSPNWLIESETR